MRQAYTATQWRSIDGRSPCPKVSCARAHRRVGAASGSPTGDPTGSSHGDRPPLSGTTSNPTATTRAPASDQHPATPVQVTSGGEASLAPSSGATRARAPAVSPLTHTAPKKLALPGPWVGEGAGLGGAGRRDRTPRPGRTPGGRWFGEPREKFNPRLYHFHDSEMGVQQGHPTPLHGRKFRPRSIGEKRETY